MLLNNSEYFHYNKIHFYKLISFDNFLKLLENGDISICFNIGIHKDISKDNFGKTNDKGTGFCISFKNIEKLYDVIDVDNYIMELHSVSGSRNEMA